MTFEYGMTVRWLKDPKRPYRLFKVVPAHIEEEGKVAIRAEIGDLRKKMVPAGELIQMRLEMRWIEYLY